MHEGHRNLCLIRQPYRLLRKKYVRQQLTKVIRASFGKKAWSWSRRGTKRSVRIISISMQEMHDKYIRNSSLRIFDPQRFSHVWNVVNNNLFSSISDDLNQCNEFVTSISHYNWRRLLLKKPITIHLYGIRRKMFSRFSI